MIRASTSDLRKILEGIPNFSTELGLDLNDDKDRLRWFLASLLFAKRISADIAKKTFRRFIDEELTDADAIIKAGWDKLVEVLDSGGYVRYDFSTATNILENYGRLKEDYDGSLEVLHEKALDSKDLEAKLMKFRGFGPVAMNIFLRELRGIWPKADPDPSKMALETARRLSLNVESIGGYESGLVRIDLEYCKKSKCRECPVNFSCHNTIPK